MAEKRTIELEIQDNSKSLKQQYREAVKELQNVAAAYGETSAEAVKAAQKAADLKDQIGFTNDLVGAFNPDAKFNALSKSIGGVLDGFQAVQGGLGIIGIEGEAVEQAMLRVQSAMALSQGLQGLMEARDSFKQLGTVAMNALKGIRTGLAATGIGLFVVALGTIVAYWDDIKAAVSGVSEEQRQLTIQSSANLEIEKKKLDAIDSQDNVLKLQGKSEKEILKYKIAQTDQTIKSAEINLESQIQQNKAALEGEKRNYNLLKSYLEFVSMPLNFLYTNAAKGINALIKLINKIPGFEIDVTVPEDLVDKGVEALTKLAFDPEQTKKDGEAQLEEQKKYLAKLKNDRAGYELQIKQINAEASKSSQDIAKDELDKKLQAEKEYNEKLTAYYDAIEAERQSKITNSKEKELQEISNKYEELYALADAAGQSDKELIAKQQAEINAVNEKYALLDAEAMRKAKEEANRLRIEQENALLDQIEQIQEQNFQNSLTEQQREIQAVNDKYFALEQAAKGNAEQEKIIAEAKAKEIEDIDKKSKEKQIQQENELRQKRLQLTASAFTAIGDLIGSFATKSDKDARKQFQIQKAFNLAAAVTNTAMAVTGALTAGGNPIKLATGAQFVEAGIAATVGAANIAKIASSKFGGGSQGGGGSAPAGGGGSGAQMQAPQFQTIGTSGVNQLATLQQQPTRAYVVSGEVTSAQSLDRNRVQNATL
jgi:hypothetical protein